jgi:hypothetical protein
MADPILDPPLATPTPAKSIFSPAAETPVAKQGNLGTSTTAEPVTAKTKLRGFEDAHLGRDATRINGEVERGIGSRFKAMTPEKHAEYLALEALVAAEQAIADSSAALEKAKQDHEVALVKLANAQKASEAAIAEAKKLADEDAARVAAANKASPPAPLVPLTPAAQPVHTGNL